jgi:RNA polymerase sigma factor (sigma-70 family)
VACRARDVAQALDTLFHTGTATGLSDRQLLERFSGRPDEAGEMAFAALVERHGPMVFRACRGILRDEHEAQDAFQATFLVLARKARSLWVRDSLGPWLHRVACRAAARARAEATRRDALNRRLLRTAVAGPGERSGGDLAAHLHEEVDRLEQRYRAPLVLCDLEGYTYEEAAQKLGWTAGAVKSRLARARERLRVRLTRGGVVASTGAPWFSATPALTPVEVPPDLSASTIRAATAIAGGRAVAEVVSAGAAALTGGVLRAMLVTKLKVLAAAGLFFGLTAGGAGLLAQATGAGGPVPVPAEVGSPRGGREDDPKAADALRRLQEEVVALREELRKVKAAQGVPGAVGFGMGMGRGMGGFGAGAGGPARPAIPTIESGEIIAVWSPGRDKVWAQSIDGGDWKEYRVPAGVKVTPILSKSLLLLMMDGATVNQVAAFEAGSGKWFTQELREPAKGKVFPIVAQDLGAVPVGRFVYAFSAPARQWGVLELAEGAKPVPLVNPNHIKVEDGTRLHVFSARTGRWSSLDTKDVGR